MKRFRKSTERVMKKSLLYRLLFSLYVTGGFSMMSWLMTNYYQKALQKLATVFGTSKAESLYAEFVAGGNIPPFPLGHRIQIFAIAVFVLTFLAPHVLKVLKRDADDAFTYGVYLCSTFLLVSIICAFINFGISSGYVSWALCYAAVFGLIGVVRKSKPDFSFVERDNLSEQAKVTRLKAEADKWLMELSILTMIILAIGISAAFLSSFQVPSEFEVRQETVTPIVVAELYLVPGMVFGIYWNVIQKVNESTRRISEIEG